MKHVIILNTHKTLKSNIYEIFLYNRIFLTQIKKTYQIILIKIQTISAKKYIRKPKGWSIRALIEKDPIPHTHIKKSKDTHTRQILASVTAIRLHRWRAWQYFTFFYSGPFLFLHFFFPYSFVLFALCFDLSAVSARWTSAKRARTKSIRGLGTRRRPVSDLADLVAENPRGPSEDLGIREICGGPRAGS